MVEDIRSYREEEEKTSRRFDEEDRRVEWEAATSDDEVPFEIPRD